MSIIFFIALYYKMTAGIFNDRALLLVESLVKAIKEEVDLVKENKTNNPGSDHKGSVSRAAINFVHNHALKKSRLLANKGLLGSTDCNSCYWPWNMWSTTCTTCPCDPQVC
jgi:hypothetical protein